jgi:hypothetical protein
MRKNKENFSRKIRAKCQKKKLIKKRRKRFLSRALQMTMIVYRKGRISKIRKRNARRERRRMLRKRRIKRSSLNRILKTMIDSSTISRHHMICKYLFFSNLFRYADSNDDSEDEGIKEYQVGGYHPVHLGEVLIGRYVIV